MQGISQMYKQIVKQEKTRPKIFHRECGCILDKIASRAIDQGCVREFGPHDLFSESSHLGQ